MDQTEAASPRRRAWWAVSVLATLYVLSFVDRSILALLVQPLKSDLGVSDIELGLLFGPAFAIFYALLGLPLARLADRGNRKLVIVCGVTLWGLCTVASGFASAYWQLVVLRIGLAIGEAALTPAAHSMIGDLFPPNRRSLAASVYSAVGMAGSSGAYILGAFAIQAVDQATLAGAAPTLSSWQIVLLIVGAPALAVGALFALTVREPARGGGHGEASSLREVATYLRANLRLYVGLFAGAGLIQAVGYAYAAWGPEVLRRVYGWPIEKAGIAFGVAGLLAGFGGTLVAPLIARRLEARGVKDAVAVTSIGALVLGVCLAVPAPLQANPYAFLVLKAMASFCLAGGTNNVLVALQTLAPQRMRATLVALLLMCITLLGLGIGPTAAAIASSQLNPDGKSLGLALAVLAPCIGLPSLLLLLWSRAALRAREPLSA